MWQKCERKPARTKVKKHFGGEVGESPMGFSNIYSVKQPDDFQKGKKINLSFLMSSQPGILQNTLRLSQEEMCLEGVGAD